MIENHPGKKGEGDQGKGTCLLVSFYFDSSLVQQKSHKGLLSEAQSAARNTCGMKSNPSVNYIICSLPATAHNSMCVFLPALKELR